MKRFSDFGIQVKSDHFEGDKIKIKRILNRKIIVLDYKIEKSKFDGNRLVLHIKFEDESRIIFTSSKMLSSAIVQVPEDAFPFETTIKEVGEAYQFN